MTGSDAFSKTTHELEKKQKVYEAYRNLLKTNSTLKDLFNVENALDETEFGQLAVDNLKQIPEIKVLFDERWIIKPIKLDELITLPEGTLGRVLAQGLLIRGFDPKYVISADPIEVIDDITYFKYLWRSTHDFHHVVAGIDTDGISEFALQAFLMGQTLIPFSIILVSFGLFKVAVERPEQIPHLIQSIGSAYRLGMATPGKFLGQKWDQLVDVPLVEVRQRLGVAIN